MNAPKKQNITVYYDGACPSCVRDRKNYEKLCGKNSRDVEWFDITGKEDELTCLGIDPKLAMTELHVKTETEQIVSELDAYILLMQRSVWLKPLSYILRTPVLKQLLACAYHWAVNRRLQRSGRL